jgi:heat shock protein HslJ
MVHTGEIVMKMNTILVATLLALLLLTLAACTGFGGSASDPLQGTSWELMAYRKTRPIPGSTITATFQDGAVGGSAGCNQYGGRYRVDGERISISEIEVTAMACLTPEGVMDQEALILQALESAQRFELVADRLMIYYNNHEALTFVPQPE